MTVCKMPQSTRSLHRISHIFSEDKFHKLSQSIFYNIPKTNNAKYPVVYCKIINQVKNLLLKTLFLFNSFLLCLYYQSD